MLASALNHQVPLPRVLIELDILVGNLPQQMIKVTFRAWCYTQGLGCIGAALVIVTAAAFVLYRWLVVLFAHLAALTKGYILKAGTSIA